ncbi:MAG: GH3 auxin-responsive promoter family protein [Pseudomonadota bacterium]
MTNPWLTLKEFSPTEVGGMTLEQCQTSWLTACLKHNRDSLFGRRHAFGGIHSIPDYRNQVPIAGYEAFRPYIERIAQGEVDILFQGKPVVFEQTGGSSGGSKLIPYSTASLADFSRAILPWLGSLVVSHGIASGTAYLALSPATRQPQLTAGGIPIGLPDGAYLGPIAGRALMELSAVPAWVGEIPEVEQWRLASLYWLVRRRELVLISVWSPSFFLQLLRGLTERQAELRELLSNGGQIAGRQLPTDRPALARLSRYLSKQDSRSLWPDLKVVSCWMDGSSRPLAEALQQQLPQAHFQAKGLLATEGVTTVPNRQGQSVLAVDSGFYEFLRDDGEIRCAWELESNQDYELVLTSAGGLYRYRTGDLVRYTGLAEDLPVLHFIGRSDLSSDLVGEKLTEAFVAQCLEGISGFCMLAPVAAPLPHYTVITDNVNANQVASRIPALEDRLMANPQYAYARKLGQLAPLTTAPHPDPLQVYTTQAALQQRLGDVKVPALLPPTMKIELFMENSS